MKKILLSALIALPMTVMAAETYKIFSVNQSTNFFKENSKSSWGPTGPGPNNLIEGDEQVGFYGETLAKNLFTGSELATAINLTQGESQHDNAPWLKFAYKDKTLFVAKKTYRNNVSWDNIKTANAVYGGSNSAIVSKNGESFKVRLLKCANQDPTYWEYDKYAPEGSSGSNTDPSESKDSEWNDLLYRVHQTKPETQEGENWRNYSNSEIIVGEGNGKNTICQEKSYYYPTKPVKRGYNTISSFNHNASSEYSNSNFGWRPVLELQK